MDSGKCWDLPVFPFILKEIHTRINKSLRSSHYNMVIGKDVNNDLTKNCQNRCFYLFTDRQTDRQADRQTDR